MLSSKRVFEGLLTLINGDPRRPTQNVSVRFIAGQAKDRSRKAPYPGNKRSESAFSPRARNVWKGAFNLVLRAYGLRKSLRIEKVRHDIGPGIK
jgi:hypothetical protein